MQKINNEFYKQSGDIWWNPNEPLNLLETVVNPARVGYFRRIIFEELKIPADKMTALEVGCGGGILCEEIAKMGFRTTGLDPSEQAVEAARKHASQSGKQIEYRTGVGEKIPFSDASFDVVFCCDVLEHVTDVGQVISEISRVLKPGGFFFYDTINRTPISRLVAIKLWQEWPAFAFMPKDLHVWQMFIKPKELLSHLRKNGFENKGLRGISPETNPLAMMFYLWKRAKGDLTVRDLGKKLKLKESGDKTVLYAGWARKNSRKESLS
jgi:2-polyprenyl-6-hydroxyphenyl methylase/3-demethylubiquinone-9 3-methyltransferase